MNAKELREYHKPPGRRAFDRLSSDGGTLPIGNHTAARGPPRDRHVRVVCRPVRLHRGCGRTSTPHRCVSVRSQLSPGHEHLPEMR